MGNMFLTRKIDLNIMFTLKFCFYFQMKETPYKRKRLQNG